MREGLDQAERLLDSFLVLARAQHGVPPDRERVALALLVGAALDARRAAIAEKRIWVHRELASADVRGSGTLLARMIDNLLDNAVRHNERDGWLRIETRADAHTATLVLENGGPRLQPDDLRRIGQPFRRLGADRVGSDNGVGLGLSIVAAIASAHAGELELTALPGGGLRAQVTLPRPG